MRVLLFFVDGVGLGDDDPAINPFVTARIPTLNSMLDGAPPTRASAGARTTRASLVGLDAQLGVPGLPQSGTGQTALLTGHNAPQTFGRHFGPWVPVRLRALVAGESVL